MKTLTWMAAAIPVALFFLASPAFAEKNPNARLRVEAGYSHEWLGNGYADWQSSYARLGRTSPDGLSLYGGWRQTDRFSLKDDAALAGFALPVSNVLSVTAEGEVSGTHHVLPAWTAFLELQGTLGGGWGLAAGARRTEYADTRLTIGDLRLERYAGNFRAAYTYFPVSSEAGGFVDSHAFQVDYYYGDHDYIRAGYATGKEVEGAGPLGLLTSEIEEYTFSGRHRVYGGWAVAYDLGSHRQGPHYTRKWAGLGFIRGF